ncbi:MAG: sigma-70 family RNA polymerase sigma factor [Clostridia bacterium]|nr:sigma-70 family RNA polymerase sigma factor [Clostridia bacterium]
MESNTSDIELIRQILDGEQDLFAELIQRYKRLAAGVIRHYFKETSESEDILQEVFIRIYRSLDRYNPQFKFSTWTVRITSNLCISLLKKKRVSTVPFEEIEKVSMESYTPEARYIDKECRFELLEAVERLPEMYRRVIKLYHERGLSYIDMANLLGSPMSIVKNRMFRARLMLRKSVSGEL